MACGDGTLLLYLIHRQQYASAVLCAEAQSQEYRNLQSQIHTVLHLPYTGSYTPFITVSVGQPDASAYCDFLLIELADDLRKRINLVLGEPTVSQLADLIQVLSVLQSSMLPPGPMQKIPRAFWTLPVWLIWCYPFDRELSERERYVLVCYRYIFWHYYCKAEYSACAHIFIMALDPHGRTEPLPLLSREVIRANMYINMHLPSANR